MTNLDFSTASSRRRQWYRQVPTWMVTLVLAFVLVGFLIWGVRLNTEKPAVQTVAPVASAPAPSASAAIEQAEETAAPPAVPSSDSTDEKRTFRFDRGDTASERFGRNAKRFCDHNAVKNCNVVRTGVDYTLPEGVEPLPRKAEGQKPQAKRQAVRQAKKAKPSTPKAVSPKTNEAGEILYTRVGVAPLKGCGKGDRLAIAEAAWAVHGLSQEDREYLRGHIDPRGPRSGIRGADKSGLVMIPNNARLEQVTFCRQGKVVATGPMRTAWGEDKAVPAEQFVLPSGKLVAWMDECFNWVVLPPVPKEEPPALKEREVPQPAPAPPLQPEQPIVPFIPVTETPPKKKNICDHLDPDATVGKEYEPSHNGGDRSDSTFATASVYCLNRLPTNDGSHGFGGKITASEWDWYGGRTGGHSSGWNVLFGPSYKRVMDAGYDGEVSLAVGRQVDRYTEGAYASRREFDLVGATFGLNDYRRRMAGEAWFPEWQVFGALTVPVKKEVGHTYFGQTIADTSELSRFHFGFQAGGRLWLYETPDMWALPYLQGGLFVQHPTSASMSLRFGFSDPDRVVGVGVGVDKDLMNGGDFVNAWGWWLGVTRGIDVVRGKVRRHQILHDADERGITVKDAMDGGHIIRFGQPKQ